MLEKEIEDKFTGYARARGCHCVKLIDDHRRGFPDRTVLMPGGRVAFIEFKRPGGQLRPDQVIRIDELRALGFECHVFDDYEKAAAYLFGVITKDAELVPCPFCDGVDVSPTQRKTAHWMTCQTCKAEGPIETDRASAMAAWNDRGPDFDETTEFKKPSGNPSGMRWVPGRYEREG